MFVGSWWLFLIVLLGSVFSCVFPTLSRRDPLCCDQPGGLEERDQRGVSECLSRALCHFRCLDTFTPGNGTDIWLDSLSFHFIF